MADYRLYCLDGRDRIVRSHWVAAESDDEALAKARELNLGHDCELWLGSRKVCRVPSTESARH